MHLHLFLVLVEHKGHALLVKFFSDLPMRDGSEKSVEGSRASWRDEIGRPSPHGVFGGNSASCVAAICDVTSGCCQLYILSIILQRMTTVMDLYTKCFYVAVLAKGSLKPHLN